MEDLKRLVRVEERLKVKIGEVKNLPSRNHSGPSGLRDVFCSLTLDQEEIYRTATVERTLNPFFGEEFQFEVPRRFRHLSVYVYDREKTEKVLGKVAVKRQDLACYDNKDHWFILKRVDSDSEVQGKCQVYLKLENNVDEKVERCTVRVIECSDLALKGGACDPYATVTMIYSNGKEETKRTKVRKKTNSPKFDETFTFEMPRGERDAESKWNCYNVAAAGWAELKITLWHDTGISEKVFLGEVKPLLTQHHATTTSWYYLQPRSKRSKAENLNTSLKHSGEPELGSIRLKLHYQSEQIMPTVHYQPLRLLLLQSPLTEPITSSAAYLLGEIARSKTDAAQPLARLMVHHTQIVELTRLLAQREIARVTDANTIFRGNSLVSKMMDEAMRLAGSHYLQATLKPAIETIITEKKWCEIDPSRVKPGNNALLASALENLKQYVSMILREVTSSALSCPPLICQLLSVLKQLAVERFPDHREAQYSVVSGFIFLRFFAPAVLGPRLFDLTTMQIDAQTNRTLTLISKSIQSIGNLVSCRSRSGASPSGVICSGERHKEQFMTRLLEDIETGSQIAAVRRFLEVISSRTNHDRAALSHTTAVVLKEGKMVKRAQGRKKFGRKNFKKRYFCLTTLELSYSKGKDKQPLCRIPLHDIKAVERLDEHSFKMKNMFQVLQTDKTLYVQAANCVEEKEWIDVLKKMCQNNTETMERYHPSAHVNGRWLCCSRTDMSEPGCRGVTKRQSLEMNIDPDRELQRIHNMLVTNMDRLETLIALCQAGQTRQGITTATQLQALNSWQVEDPASCGETLRALRQMAFTLETQQRSCIRLINRQGRYGSEQTPIGDDNYLHLASRSRLDPSKLDSQSLSGISNAHQSLTPLASGVSSLRLNDRSVYTILKYGEEFNNAES